MRVLELAAILGFLGGCAAIGRAAWRATIARGAVAAARWEPYHRVEGAGRTVYVRRRDELEPVGEVSSADPDYDMVFLGLMDRARERAAMLNSER